jgi:predicted Zn-dependent peptidase
MLIQEHTLQTAMGPIPLLLLPVEGRTMVSVRIMVQSGSVDEQPEEYGIAHFLEHMAFKGTDKHSCNEINSALASIGSPNAYTNYDKTVYYINTIPSLIPNAAELLAEIFFHSIYPEEELEKERGVILQEWQQYEDNPQSFYFNNAVEHVFGQPAHSIIGTDQHIKTHTRDMIANFKHRTYTSNNIVIAVVGNIPNPEYVVKELSDIFSQEGTDIKIGYANTNKVDLDLAFKAPNDMVEIKHNSTQAWLGMWWNWFSDEQIKNDNYTSYVFENALGDGLHSILQTELREKRGLCYSSGCFTYDVKDNNSFVIYSMLLAEKIDEAHTEVIKILKDIKDNGIKRDLVKVSKSNFLIKSSQSFDGQGKYTHAVDNWLRIRYLMGNNLFTMADAEKATQLFDQSMAKNIADMLLSNKHHFITMTSKDTP